MKKRHEVLIGPYRSGKSWSLLERAFEHCLRQENLANETLIIVPSQRYRALIEKRLQKFLLAKKTKEDLTQSHGLWGLKILTFSQFCETSLLKAGIFTKVLPEAARLSLAANLGRQLVDMGKITKLAPVINFSGTQASILSLIDEWQSAGYRAAAVLKQIKAKETDGHHIELAQIYTLYEQTLDQSNYTDEQGLMFKLIDLLNANGKVDWLSDFVVVDGFDRWHILQLKLLKSMSKHVSEMYISFDYEQPGDNLLEEYAWKEKSHEQINEILGDGFAFEKKSSQPDANDIAVFCAGDRLAESAIIAARVKASVTLDEIDPSEIVVTARNLETYKSAFEAAFQDAGLDYCLDETIELVTLPVVQFLLSLLSLAENGFCRREVIDCLRSQYFRKTGFNISKENIEHLNMRSLRDNVKVVAGREQWQEAAKDDTHLAAVLRNIFDLLSPPSNFRSAIEYATWVEDLLDEFFDYSAVSDNHIEAVNKFRECLANLIEQEEILRVCGIKSVAAKSYHQRFVDLVKKANSKAALLDAGKVLIAEATLVPNEKYKQIYVAGMLEGEFPAHNTGKGFLTPEELAQWQRFGIPIYDPRLESGFEYALFASLRNRAQKQITFSYPVADIISSKEEPVPSFFLTGQNFVKETDQLEVLSFEDFSKTANSPRNALAYCLWRQEPLTDLARQQELLNEFIYKLEEKLSFAHKRYQQLSLSPLSGYLADHIVAGTVKIDMPEYWSASGLNEYGKCPFSYWLTRVLKVSPHSEPEAGLFIMEKGSFYHKVLELFYKEVIDRKLSMTAQSDDDLKAIFEQSIAAGISWLENERWFRPSEFWAQEKEDLKFHLRNFFDHERRRFLKEGGEFVPYMVEVEFGPQAAAKPLIINYDGRVIKVRGKIDRIDVESSKSEILSNLKRLRLIDYKSGSTLPTDADFESGRNIQLALYALAAQEAIMPGSRVEDCSYLSVRAGKSSTQEGPVLHAYLSAVPAKVMEFVQRIESGDFSLKPSNPNVCKNCDHQKVCRVKEFPRRTDTDQEWENTNYD